MEFSRFVRTPFVVEAVQINKDNLEEIAKLIGEVKSNEKGLYIAIDRRIVPNVTKVYPGWWLTKLNDNLRCYSPKVFKDQFTDFETVIAFDFANTVSEGQPVG